MALYAHPVVAGDPTLDAAVEKTATRWSRLPICKVVVDSHYAEARVPVKLTDQLWDRSAWKPIQGGLHRLLNFRFEGDDFDLAVRAIDDPDAADDSWISFVAGEAMQVNRPASARPTVKIQPRSRLEHLLFDKALTALEHQYFDQQVNWSDLLTDYAFAARGTEQLDGLTCVRLENTKQRDVHEMTIWVCPNYDYAPVRAEHRWLRDGRLVSDWQLRVASHQKVGNSWIADSAMIAFTRQDLDFYQMASMRVLDVQVGREHQPRSLRSQLPGGAYVQDTIRERSWTVGADGQPTNMRGVDEDRLLRMITPLSATELELERQRERWCAAGSAMLALALLLLIITVVRRRKVKFLVTGVTVLVLIMWPVSMYWGISYEPGPRLFPGPTRIFDKQLNSEVHLTRCFGIGWGKAYVTASSWGNLRSVGIHAGWLRGRTSWWPDYTRLSGTISQYSQLGIPLWIPLLLLMPLTIWMWWRDRPVPPGCCTKCGYDLTGNTTGVCPECGDVIEGTMDDPCSARPPTVDS